MGAHVGLGNPENGRDAVRACAGAFNIYAHQLRHDLDWYANQRFSLLNVDELLARVTRVADALSAEARFLERRSQLREADATDVPAATFPMLDATIDAVIAGASLSYVTGPAASVLEERGDGARKEPF